METRSCPSMNELRGVARVMGMKYFRHLSKLELHQALQRQLHQVERAQAKADLPKPKGKDAKGRGTRRFWWRKSKNKNKGNAATTSSDVQVLNTLDPIMLSELGPHTVLQLKSNDREYASHCHKHYVEYLRGPPNRPTVDESGLFGVVLDFMKQMAGKAPTAQRYGA
ncbi:hypothetical protein DYB37_000399 [Aphanomyces astaci]|uniref:Uncharacterized protein n=1 Tax=Aphanomyces astaci TaxID=112090 RepID=A0A397BWV3_APHAT|nr:hypothetical protein DYB36_001713 [Aphanomyces astaci]RHY32880.1 hypothetical protein DYB25_001824 [Aphanomyces astaci]RHY53178.1 hypothetical protein DYB34_000779 [Aphanomyces astaci]RHY55061.1 hypothetical protein DYB30_003822 [Aphanomyces astaci]RHY67846.1 hypothetical protein DYB38_004305 [Aphanomyces astaci]